MLLGAVSLALLGGILVAGLWPFHSPENRVTWLDGENGLRFAEPGTIMSSGEFGIADSSQSSCSIEVWVQPDLGEASNTLLAFHTAQNPVQLALRQSLSDLEITRDVAGASGERRMERFHVDRAFRAGRPLFLTISSSERGTAVYIDGVLAREDRGVRIAAADCTGRLIVGTSPVGNDAWVGRLKGLAIYHHELTPAQVAQHYKSWIATGKPDLASDERCTGLYLFQEHRGSLVHNQISESPHLLIPAKYRIEDQTLLMPFWKEFDLPDILENIVGFVPLGFFFYAYFSMKRPARKTALLIVVLGGLVSITIEALQSRLPTRQSDSTDVLTNTLGTWLGVKLFRSIGGLDSLAKRK